MTNVISTTNGRKKLYGTNHWFWAVWIGASDFRSWDSSDPTVSGFCDSEATARRAAWQALAAHVPQGVKPTAYWTNWAREYLWSLQTRDKRLYFSRCKIGTNKWQWVVLRVLGDDPVATGVAASPEAAQQEAEAHVGPVQNTGNWAADSYRKKCLAIERSRKTSANKSTSSLEFVYRCYRYYSDYDNSSCDVVEKYVVVKRTKNRVYVDRKPYREDAELAGDWHDFVRPTFVLDRSQLETCGVARRKSRGWWSHETYYVDPTVYFAERASQDAEMAEQLRPECFTVLDLPFGATRSQVKAAYRQLARKVHPDAGGDAEEFKRVHRAFEEAMAFAVNEASVV